MNATPIAGLVRVGATLHNPTMARFRITDAEPYRKLTVRVLEDLYEAFATEARARGISINELANRLIAQFVAAQEPAPVSEWLQELDEAHKQRLKRFRRSAGP